MAKAIAFTRSHIAPLQMADCARAMIVSGCGLALLLAGPALPL